MGCSESRELQNFNFQNLEQVEESLGFSKIPSETLENTFYKYSKDNKLTSGQLARALESLNLKNQTLSKFFDLFRNKAALKHELEFYDVQKLATFGILIGSGSEEQKIKLLFRNYDFQTKKYLSVADVKILVEDILEVFIEIVTKYGKSLINTQAFEDYSKSLVKAFNISHEFFLELILLDETKVTEEEFCNCFLRVEMKCLLKPQKLRSVCYTLYTTIVEGNNVRKFNTSSTSES